MALKFALVLEDDLKFQAEITESLKTLNKDLVVRVFSGLVEFAAWIKILMEKGPVALDEAGIAIHPDDQKIVVGAGEVHLQILILKQELLGGRNLGLIKKTLSLFLQKQLCPAEHKTAIVFTAFEGPEFKIREVEDRAITNVIYKPFDKPILKQHLQLALVGHQASKESSVFTHKSAAIVEMLKEVQLESVSEFGFATRSNREIEVGRVGKYYSEHFLSASKRSAIATAVHCQPHGTVENEFSVAFQYFGLKSPQISHLRKYLQSHQPSAEAVDKKVVHKSPPQKNPVPDKILNYIYIESPSKFEAKLDESAARFFSNVKMVKYQNWADFYIDLDPKAALLGSESGPSKKKIDCYLPFEGDAVLLYDIQSRKIFEMPAELKPDVLFLEFTLPEVMSTANFFSKQSPQSEQAQILEFLAHDLNTDVAPIILKLKTKSGQSTFVSITRLPSLEPQKTNLRTLRLRELNIDEQVSEIQKRSGMPATIDGVFIDILNAGAVPFDRAIALLEQIRSHNRNSSGTTKPQFYLLTNNLHSDAEERTLATGFADLFYYPVDRSYVLKKMHLQNPELVFRDAVDSPMTCTTSELMKTAIPIELAEISEASVVFKYHRAISIGSFRELALWLPHEKGMPEFLACCNFTEEVQGEKGSFANHFTFFGLNDRFLKHIRTWIKQKYIHSKETAST